VVVELGLLQVLLILVAEVVVDGKEQVRVVEVLA
jgi:hypothetical protein